MKDVNGEVTPGKEKSSEEAFGGIHWKYSNQTSKILSSVLTKMETEMISIPDENKITKKTQPIPTISET